ncbi:cysteine-rich small domain-containing protein [bacterium 210820-DFI.6.37]|nr:cysteine-rich small domain-containing protein [bacterium 210820-DFI.6.37]
MEQKEPKKYKFFSHTECEFFPCHKTDKPETFNCLFCYCPLYALGEDCGGNFSFTDNGIKDCTNCLIPHSTGGFDYIMERYGKISDLIKKERNK